MNSPRTRQPGGHSSPAWAGVLGLLVLVVAGCSRAYYRRQADNEVYALVDQAADDPRWPLEDYTIQPDFRSRMFDPNSPDCPPMPPDDPESHRLMRRVDGKRGWPFWDCHGHTPFVENAGWIAFLPYRDDGSVVLDRRSAVQLSLLDSREYQSELENLYLSALDVTFERFRFDTQFYGDAGGGTSNLNTTSFTTDGRDRGGGNSASTLATNTGLRLERLMATGTELVVGVANSLVWQFSGPNEQTTTTLLDFSLVQPLLRAGGRAVVMKELTDSERALLANIRQMERFRRGFYTEIVVGNDAGAGPARGGVGISSVSLGGAGSAGGLFGLLEDQLRIRNRRANVARLRQSLQRLEAFQAAGRIDRFQVDQNREALLGAQVELLASETDYQNQLDAYKVLLGLPPDLDIRIEDPLLKRFNLIDPDLTALQEAVDRLSNRLRNPEQGDDLEPSGATTLAAMRQKCADQLAVVRQNIELLAQALPARRRHLKQLSQWPEFRRGDVDPSAFDPDGLDRRFTRLNEDFLTGTVDSEPLAAGLQRTLAELEPFEQGIPPAEEADDDAQKMRREKLLDLISMLSDQLMELSLVQARARVDTVMLAPVDLQPPEAFETAYDNRRDWMNARAALVDSWRQIEVAANDLRSGLDMTFSGDLGTTGNNPVRFRGTTGQLRVGLEFDAPLTRLVERNAYRETLIAYQRARRDYYAFEDQIYQSLRRLLRTLRLNQLNFELNRAEVRVAVDQVDQQRLRLKEPPKPGQKAAFGATTVRDLVQALSGLLRAQNSFLNVWVDNEAQRMILDFNLGTMQLDRDGMWIDPGPIESSKLENSDVPEEIPAPEGQPDQLEEHAPIPEDLTTAPR